MRFNIIVYIFLFVFSYGAAFAENENIIDMVDNLRESSKKENNKYQGKIEDVYEAMKKKEAKEVNIKAIPPVSSYEIFAKDQNNILDAMNLPNMNAITQDAESCADPERLGNYKIFVLISENVPMDTLKNYMQDALKLGDMLLVLRGVIGSADYIKPTEDFITEISCGKKLKDIKSEDKCNISRVDINPFLFTLFKADKVPAIVYTPLSYSDLMTRSNLNQSLTESEYFIIKGDMSVRYALERFQAAGADTENYIKILKGSY